MTKQDRLIRVLPPLPFTAKEMVSGIANKKVRDRFTRITKVIEHAEPGVEPSTDQRKRHTQKDKR